MYSRGLAPAHEQPYQRSVDEQPEQSGRYQKRDATCVRQHLALGDRLAYDAFLGRCSGLTCGRRGCRSGLCSSLSCGGLTRRTRCGPCRRAGSNCGWARGRSGRRSNAVFRWAERNLGYNNQADRRYPTIHSGPILLSGPLEPVERLQTLRVLRRGSAFSSHLRRKSRSTHSSA
jgi:hypothetical protein